MDAGAIAGLFAVRVSVSVADPGIDRGGLFPEEEALVAGAVTKRREEFAAGRNAARAALAGLGLPPCPLLRAGRRAPAWPQGIVGSITHCSGFCCAVVAPAASVRSLGIDAETGEPLEEGLAALVCRPDELARFAYLPVLATTCWPKLAFSAKEAFYKCVDPVLGEFLDFHEVAVRFAPGPARDGGGFGVSVLKPGLAARVPTPLLAGRWAADPARVYTAVTWPGA
jgi:4'-phosphopantetheinyl transferase EntD